MSIARQRRSVKVSPRSYDVSGLPTRYFNPGELETLLCLFESVSAKTVIEFGVNNGRNPAAALRNIKSIERYVGIDVEQGYRTAMPVQRREIPRVPGELALGDARFDLIVRPRGSFDLAADDLPPADAIFIDADHSERGVRNDTSLALEVVKPGGIIIWHDDNCLPVVQVTQTLNALQRELDLEISHIEGTWLSFARL